MLPATEVVVAGKEMLRGVISTLPPHLQSGDKNIGEISDFAVDIGFDAEKAKNLFPSEAEFIFFINTMSL